MLDDILNFIFPTSCIACEEPSDTNGLQLCSKCTLLVPKELRDLGESSLIEERWALASYDSPLGIALRKAKFGKDIVLMQNLAKALSEGVRHSGKLKMNTVTHVPTSLRREFFRGFDQAEVLAHEVAHSLQVPHCRLLKRLDSTEQSTKSLDERITDPVQFKAIGMATEVLIVDDVCTSGGSLEAAAQELLMHGVKKVKALTLLSRQI